MIDLTDAPDWTADGERFPLRDQSFFIDTEDFRWRVARMGAGPCVLMIHGVGASAHSWAGAATRLADRFDVIAFDLPGHGFTRAKRRVRPTLEHVAAQVAALAVALDAKPDVLAGHSAGAAIMIEMMLRGSASPRAAVSVNGALEPFGGPAASLFPMMAQALRINPLTPLFFARAAGDRQRVERLIAQTGSDVAKVDVDAYAALLSRAGQISGALDMMGNWNLAGLTQRLTRLETPIAYLAGARDRATPPEISERAAAATPSGTFRLWPNVGHLAHEEDPETAARRIAEAWRR